MHEKLGFIVEDNALSSSASAYIERIANAVAWNNATYFAERGIPTDFLPEYELPRETGVGQVFSGVAIMLRRNKATCIEYAAYCCGIELVNGIDCRVIVVPTRRDDGNYRSGTYHALIQFADGRVLDPTAMLPGFNDLEGYCCNECAVEARVGFCPLCLGM